MFFCKCLCIRDVWPRALSRRALGTVSHKRNSAVSFPLTYIHTQSTFSVTFVTTSVRKGRLCYDSRLCKRIGRSKIAFTPIFTNYILRGKMHWDREKILALQIASSVSLAQFISCFLFDRHVIVPQSFTIRPFSQLFLNVAAVYRSD